jgi:glycosyltransferase 2 family protein
MDMKSNSSAKTLLSKSELSLRGLFPLARIAVGVALIAVLLYWGNLDLRALAALGDRPWTAAAAGVLVLLTLPICALRWAIILRALDIAVPFVPIFHIQCISTLFGQFLLGPTSGDAIRGVYAWRILRRGSGRIAVSIVVDRLTGLLALMLLAAFLATLSWHRIREVPQLMVLVLSLAAALTAALAGIAALLAAPTVLSRLRRRLYLYPRLQRLLDRTHDVLSILRRSPIGIAAIFCLSLLAQCAALLAFVIVARNLGIGNLTSSDYLLSASLATVANSLPVTPGGLGVGEIAFDQVCQWIASAPGAVPYASIFFAFRAVSTLMLLVGMVSFVIHRSNADRLESQLSHNDGVPTCRMDRA